MNYSIKFSVFCTVLLLFEFVSVTAFAASSSGKLVVPNLSVSHLLTLPDGFEISKKDDLIFVPETKIVEKPNWIWPAEDFSLGIFSLPFGPLSIINSRLSCKISSSPVSCSVNSDYFLTVTPPAFLPCEAEFVLYFDGIAQASTALRTFTSTVSTGFSDQIVYGLTTSPLKFQDLCFSPSGKTITAHLFEAGTTEISASSALLSFACAPAEEDTIVDCLPQWTAEDYISEAKEMDVYLLVDGSLHLAKNSLLYKPTLALSGTQLQSTGEGAQYYTLPATMSNVADGVRSGAVAASYSTTFRVPFHFTSPLSLASLRLTATVSYRCVTVDCDSTVHMVVGSSFVWGLALHDNLRVYDEYGTLLSDYVTKLTNAVYNSADTYERPNRDGTFTVSYTFIDSQPMRMFTQGSSSSSFLLHDLAVPGNNTLFFFDLAHNSNDEVYDYLAVEFGVEIL